MGYAGQSRVASAYGRRTCIGKALAALFLTVHRVGACICRGQLVPREKRMLLEISRIFWKMAMNDQAALVAGGTEAQQAEQRGAFERHLILAGDHAYKAAPY
jgi:hypothetical protein